MKAPFNFKFIFCLILIPMVSCKHKIQKGSDLTKSEIEYIKALGLLDDEENIMFFDSQLNIKTSGNFFSDKRIASYWIDKRDSSETSINFGLYEDIDTILTKDLTRSLTFASYLEVIKSDGKRFKVHVDGDSLEVKKFFDLAISEWKKQTANKKKHAEFPASSGSKSPLQLGRNICSSFRGCS